MDDLYRPMEGERWQRKTDPSKVLVVYWTNSCDYVQFHAPWMKRHIAGCGIDTFHKRYERANPHQQPTQEGEDANQARKPI